MLKDSPGEDRGREVGTGLGLLLDARVVVDGLGVREAVEEEEERAEAEGAAVERRQLRGAVVHHDGSEIEVDPEVKDSVK